MNAREITVGLLRVLGVWILAAAVIDVPDFLNRFVQGVVELINIGRNAGAEGMFLPCMTLLAIIVTMALRIVIGIYLMKAAERLTAWMIGDKPSPSA